jgi:hypothetical protein
MVIQVLVNTTLKHMFAGNPWGVAKDDLPLTATCQHCCDVH